jgi:hypothetical protein
MTTSLETDPLDDDPFDDDLAAQLARRASRPPTRLTLGLGGVVLVVAGFIGGVLVEKGRPTNSSGNNNTPSISGTGFPGRFGGGAGGNGSGGAGGQGAASTITGTVKFVDGTTVYITTSDGQTVTVKTNSTTTVQSQQTLNLSDLAVGATVSVRGSTGSDGTVTATQVTTTK